MICQTKQTVAAFYGNVLPELAQMAVVDLIRNHIGADEN